jgi:hypothetical protein
VKVIYWEKPITPRLYPFPTSSFKVRGLLDQIRGVNFNKLVNTVDLNLSYYNKGISSKLRIFCNNSAVWYILVESPLGGTKHSLVIKLTKEEFLSIIFSLKKFNAQSLEVQPLNVQSLDVKPKD